MANNTRGIRNNNPGNIRRDATKWQGLADEQLDAAFFTFKDPVMGIRAIARILIAYQDNHGCLTIDNFIDRWAPPVENDSVAYAGNVARSMGFQRATLVDMHKYDDLYGMVRGIIYQENGGDPYTKAQVDKALLLAGVEPPKRSLIASPQVIGSAIAGAATVAGPVVQQVQSSLQPLTDYSETIKHAFVVVALIGVILAAWSKISERRKGIS